MSNLSDLFISYKVVDAPAITIPRYTPDFSTNTVIQKSNLATKVNNVKARMKDSPTFKWTSGGHKEAPYPVETKSLLPAAPQTETTTTPTPVSQVGGNWKKLMLEAYKRAGCSELFAKNLVGLDALETGWGKHVVGDYNYGNIKAGKSWSGNSKRAYDRREGSNDAYRSYTSVDDYVQDKLRLLRDRYGMIGNETAELFTDKLVAGGYATGKQYKLAVLKTINSV